LKQQAYPILVLLLVMWLVRIVDAVIPADLNQFGLVPRSLHGLAGIGLMPFLHGSFGHLIANTIPLVILLGLTVASRRRPWWIIGSIIFCSGALLWLFGRSAYHIGASGLVFGLIAYLITAGVREKQLASISVALLVGAVFGATLLSGIVPRIGSAISWDGHLLGAASGLLVGIGSSQKTEVSR
jgi:membrane associated rhomboid family serine protease